MKRILLFISGLIISQLLLAQDLKQYNVKDFGATGDGNTDDTKSIQKCLDAAARQGGRVIFPEGSYKTSGNLFLNYHKNVDIELVGRNATLYPTNKYYYLFCDNTRVTKEPIGKIKIQGLHIDGSKLPHPQSYYFDDASCAYGIFLTNLKSILIQDCKFSNIYGSAIKLVLMKDINDTTLKTSVIVKNNKILNCWGLNPTKDYYDKKNPNKYAYDNYGDGIAIWGYRKAVIDRNYIYNNVAVTKFYGRAGVVIEHDGENAIITNNTIYGYDRNIHIEIDKGGHYIANNKFSGSNVGIFFWLANNWANRPSTIINNTFSYNKEAQRFGLKTIVGDRKYIMFAGKGTTTYQGTTVKGNTFLNVGNKGSVMMTPKNLRIMSSSNIVK